MCPARRWPLPEVSEAPVEVGRDQLSKDVATQEDVSLIERNTFVHGEVISVRLDGDRARIHHGQPFICFAAYAQHAQDQSRLQDCAASFAGLHPQGEKNGSRRSAFRAKRPPSSANSAASGLLPP